VTTREKELLSKLVKQGSLREATDKPAYVTADQQPLAPRTLPRGLLLLILVLVWHAAWLLALTPVTGVALFRAPVGTALAVLPDTDPAEGTSVADGSRALWTPLLLSLPSPVGFSGSIGGGGLKTVPSLELPGEEVLFLSADEAAPLETVVDTPRVRLLRQAASRLAEPPPGLDSAPDGALLRPPETEPIHVTLLHGEPAESLRRPAWPTDVLEKTGRPWEAVIRLQIGPDGDAGHLMLDAPTDDRELNQALVRALADWQWDPQPVMRRVHVQLRSYGAAPLADEEEEARAP
jgi:hypothetical protein